MSLIFSSNSNTTASKYLRTTFTVLQKHYFNSTTECPRYYMHIENLQIHNIVLPVEIWFKIVLPFPSNILFLYNVSQEKKKNEELLLKEEELNKKT